MPIRIRLNVVLGTRRLRIADVHRETGIARGTLADLYYDRTKRPDLAVLARLCAFLECQPGDLLEYVPDAPARED